MSKQPSPASALDRYHRFESVPAPASRLRFELQPGRVAAAACLGLLLLLALDIAGMLMFFNTGDGLLRRISRFVMMDIEANIPTLANFALLVGVLFLLVTLTIRAYASADSWRRHWLGLCLIFLFLSYDEAAQMHEELISIVGRFVDRAGVFYFAWVIPGAIFALAVAAVFLRFVLALPRPEARLVLLGGALYLGGAIGLEMIGGAYAEDHGMMSPTYQLIATLEEALEMLGLIVFGYALLRLLADRDGRVRLGAAPR